MYHNKNPIYILNLENLKIIIESFVIYKIIKIQANNLLLHDISEVVILNHHVIGKWNAS